MDLLLQNKGSLLLAVGFGAMTFFLMRFWSRRYLPSSSPQRSESFAPRRPRETTPHQPLRDALDDIARWQVEMHDLARNLQGELDTKIAVLQRLVIDARAEAERLEALVERASVIDSSQPPR